MLTHIYALSPEAPPGLGDRLDKLGAWIMYLSYTACFFAFIAGAGYLAWEKMTNQHGHGSKVAMGAVIGSILVASSTTLIKALQS